MISWKTIVFCFAAIVVAWCSPERLFSQNRMHSSPSSGEKSSVIAQATPAKERPPQELIDVGAMERPSLITQAVVLTLLSLLPFIIMILTSFLKIVIVLSLLRNALGVQQAPPNQIINGVALMLSLFVMYPTVVRMYEASQKVTTRLQAPESLISPESSAYILEVAKATQEPLREFLINNSSVKHRALFYRISYKVLPEEYRPELTPDDFIIVVPSYITSQLKDAFEIGVLIYIPFFVIDLVTSNILLAMGMMMLSPVTISMPLKLFLLVMLDGWTLLIEGLVNTFR
ncbi:MAG: type III secretion system export apparatus subunit SctR [Waddliaceae bacterium]